MSVHDGRRFIFLIPQMWGAKLLTVTYYDEAIRAFAACECLEARDRPSAVEPRDDG